MMMGVYDAAAICKAIAVDFKVKGLTHETAASQLECSKQTVSNQISGKKKFSLKTAQRYAETFGYNLEFLLFGKGELNGSSSGLVSVDEAPSVQESDECSASISVKQLNQIQDLLRVLNNNDACNAFDAVLAGDESKYKSLYEKLRRDFGWDISLAAVDKEYLDRIRRVLSDVQESRSKILASYKIGRASCRERV